MNKEELVEEVAKCAGVSKSKASRCIDCYHKVIQGALGRREEVRLVGHGTFSVIRRSARVGRNPRTGAKIHIPASNVVKFKASSRLKAATK